MFLKESEIENVEGDNIGGCTLCMYAWLVMENRLLLFKSVTLLKKVIAIKNEESKTVFIFSGCRINIS